MAALADLNSAHLAGIALDVFPTEPYLADGPLLAHPPVVATAPHTSDYFAAASRRLGEPLAAYINYQPPAGLLKLP
jgi:phosphoglycerate dehydrogenase-like enzyme